MIKSCQICGKSFVAKQRTQLICSEACRHIKRLAYMKKRTNFPDKFICQHCGKEISNAKRRTRKFCDDCKRQRSILRLAAIPLNLEKRRAADRRRYLRHRVKFLASNKIYRKENRAFIRLKDRERYRRNPQPKKTAHLRYYHLHKDSINPRRYIRLKLREEENGQRFLPFCHTCGKKIPKDSPHKKYCSVECYRKSPLFRFWLRIKSQLGY